HNQARWNGAGSCCYQDGAGKDGRDHSSIKSRQRRKVYDPVTQGGCDVKSRILVIEDERAALQSLSLLLSDENYDVLQADCGHTGLTIARQEEPDLILLDIRLPDLNGLQVLDQIRQERIDAAVIIMTADTTSSNAIQATQLGAFDYIAKPINDEHLLVLIRRALEYRTLDRELRKLRITPPPHQPLSGFVGHSAATQEV